MRILLVLLVMLGACTRVSGDLKTVRAAAEPQVDAALDSARNAFCLVPLSAVARNTVDLNNALAYYHACPELRELYVNLTNAIASSQVPPVQIIHGRY